MHYSNPSDCHLANKTLFSFSFHVFLFFSRHLPRHVFFFFTPIRSLTIEVFENTSELQGDSNFARVKVDSGFFLEGVFEGLAEPSQSVSHYQDKIGERPPRDLSHGVRIVGAGSELLG